MAYYERNAHLIRLFSNVLSLQLKQSFCHKSTAKAVCNNSWSSFAITAEMFCLFYHTLQNN